MKKYFLITFIFFSFSGCIVKQPQLTNSVTILFKTKALKFYDKAFITKYKDKVHLSAYSTGKLILDIDVYPKKICKGIFQCVNSSEFNQKYFDKSYQENFLYLLLQQTKIDFKDTINNVRIKTFDVY